MNIINISGLFKNIIAGNDYNIKNKPHPDIYLKTAEIIGVKPDECIVIEDSSNGAKASLEAGMKTLVVLNKYTKKQKFPDKAIILKSFLKVQNYIDNINKEGKI